MQMNNDECCYVFEKLPSWHREFVPEAWPFWKIPKRYHEDITTLMSDPTPSPAPAKNSAKKPVPKKKAVKKIKPMIGPMDLYLPRKRSATKPPPKKAEKKPSKKAQEKAQIQYLKDLHRRRLELQHLENSSATSYDSSTMSNITDKDSSK